MKNNFCLVFGLLLVTKLTVAQPGFFLKSLGPTNFSGSNDNANAIRQTPDGGYIVCGSTQSYGAGSIDVYLAKYDANAALQWSKTYGTPNYEAGYHVIITVDSGYLVSGGLLDTGQTTTDMLLFKTDASGVVQWSKQYGGIMSEQASSLEGIQQTSDMGYIMTGTTNGYDAIISNNIALVKTDSQGDTLWTKVYTAPGFDQALAVQQTFDGGYIICGRTNEFGAGQLDALLIKTDSTGVIEWTKAYGGAEGEEAMCVKQTPDSGFILTGATYSFVIGYADIYVIKTNSNGDVQWSRSYGEIGLEASYSICTTIDGGYAITGFTESYISPASHSTRGDDSSNVVLLKIDSAGLIQWSHLYGGLLLDEAYCVTQTSDTGYVIAATTRSFGSDSTDNGLIIHTDKNGNADCFSKMIVMLSDSDSTVVTPGSYTYSYGFDYSDYTLAGIDFQLTDQQLCLPVHSVSYESPAEQVTLIPNPAHQFCTVTAPGIKNTLLELRDITGRKIMTKHFNAAIQINLSELLPGIYLVEIKNPAGFGSVQKKLVVE